MVTTCSKVLGLWRADSKEWTHPYPDMPTARAQGSAVVYKECMVSGDWWCGEAIIC